MMMNVALALCASIVVPTLLVEVLGLESSAAKNAVATTAFAACILLATLTLAGV